MESPRQSECDLQEKVEYWKKQAKYYEQKANDIQQELDEYTENSAQLEKELEASLVQVEKQNRDLEHQNQRLKNEIEMLRTKLERSQNEMGALENELQTLKMEKDKQATYVRELEQKNDDLERGQRVISESVSCIESLLNQAYERNAVLESEVDEIENLRVKLQRATDEARDLKQELKVIEKVPHKEKEDSSENDNTLLNGHVSNARTQVEIETQTSISSPQKREINGNALTPSSRVTAINIVGDLLRKVGLERFLCRECGKVKCSCDAPGGGGDGGESLEPMTAACPVPPPRLTAETPHTPHTAARQFSLRDAEDDIIEFRRATLVRQLSGPDNNLPQKPPISPPPLSHRASEQPFTRSSQGENGKLRRSFVVRSREGLENLLGLRKNDQVKTKHKKLYDIDVRNPQ